MVFSCGAPLFYGGFDNVFFSFLSDGSVRRGVFGYSGENAEGVDFSFVITGDFLYGYDIIGSYLYGGIYPMDGRRLIMTGSHF